MASRCTAHGFLPCADVGHDIITMKHIYKCFLPQICILRPAVHPSKKLGADFSGSLRVIVEKGRPVDFALLVTRTARPTTSEACRSSPIGTERSTPILGNPRLGCQDIFGLA
jgi:hypothetical protein